MNNPEPIGALIPIAARLASCDALIEVYEICENQKSISTEKLERAIDRIANKLKDEAFYIRTTFNRVKGIEQIPNADTK